MQIPNNPAVYEIHTAAYLNRLSKEYERTITLGTVPDDEWDKLAILGMDAVWLMGVWQRSPAGVTISLQDDTFEPSMKEAVPDLQREDIIGSAYCIKDYVADEMFGGPEGLAIARSKLREQGLGLILDFVPNHVAPDHAWTAEHPDYFITGSHEDLIAGPEAFVECAGTVIAKGRDPFFAPWPDVIQLNAFSEGYRQAAIATLDSVGEQCDGVRCDMAMLMMNDIFTQTWGERAGSSPQTDFWATIIPAVRKEHPDMLFLAEVYWDKEQALLDQGFDYCYDKKLYDVLLENSAPAVLSQLIGTSGYQSNLCRFIENHDEARAAAEYSPEKERAAAVATLTLPGMRLLHDGQMEGFRTKIPVHLASGPEELANNELYGFYQKLLTLLATWQFDQSNWYIWNTANEKVLIWEWRNETARHIVVINYSNETTTATIHSAPEEQFVDELSGGRHAPNGDSNHPVVSLELQPWGVYLLTAVIS